MNETSMEHGRREFLARLSLGAAALAFPLSFEILRSANAQAQTNAADGGEDHFFLFIMTPGGMDASYRFDARPLEMTHAGKIQNYQGSEPKLWTGKNGGSCLVSPAMRPLLPHLREGFSIINGVVMDPGFEGHLQSSNILMSGSPFGGEFFVPHLNAVSSRSRAILDAVQSGIAEATLSNIAGIVPLNSRGIQKILERLKSVPGVGSNPTLFEHLRSRMQANALGPSRFSLGSRAMVDGFRQVGPLVESLKALQLKADNADEPEQSFLEMSLQLFSMKVTRSAVLQLRAEADTHDLESARLQPKNFLEWAGKIAKIMDSLQKTAFDANRSFLDVTTVLIGSEFSRTMRQEGFAIDKTGTDHNPLTNSFLIGGKGIQGGHVLGASDFQASNEKLSATHLQLDPKALRIMGRPFDHSLQRNRPAPEGAAYDPALYLTSGSVVNTVYSLFGVSPDLLRRPKAGGPAAPNLTSILKS